MAGKVKREPTDLEWALDILDSLLAITGVVLTRDGQARLDRLKKEIPNGQSS